MGYDEKPGVAKRRRGERRRDPHAAAREEIVFLFVMYLNTPLNKNETQRPDLAVLDDGSM